MLKAYLKMAQKQQNMVVLDKKIGRTSLTRSLPCYYIVSVGFGIIPNSDNLPNIASKTGTHIELPAKVQIWLSVIPASFIFL